MPILIIFVINILCRLKFFKWFYSNSHYLLLLKWKHMILFKYLFLTLYTVSLFCYTKCLFRWTPTYFKYNTWIVFFIIYLMCLFTLFNKYILYLSCSYHIKSMFLGFSFSLILFHYLYFRKLYFTYIKFKSFFDINQFIVILNKLLIK